MPLIRAQDSEIRRLKFETFKGQFDRSLGNTARQIDVKDVSPPLRGLLIRGECVTETINVPALNLGQIDVITREAPKRLIQFAGVIVERERNAGLVRYVRLVLD